MPSYLCASFPTIQLIFNHMHIQVCTGIRWHLSQGFYGCDKVPWQKAWEERVYFILKLVVHHLGKSRQKLKAEFWRQDVMQRPLGVLITDLLLTNCLLSLLSYTI